MKLLIDTSVWIPFLRGHGELPAEVSEAMREGSAYICPVVWIEIFRGVRGKNEERIANELAELCPQLPMDGESWDEAARLGREAMRKGLNCPLADVLVAACARRHETKLVHDDKHLASLLEI